MDTQTAWIGSIAYTLQIYFDFSAYSDMAIGLGMLFGFKLPENFNRPYSAVSITDFWRRWHMTLSRFFKDYVYIPLGGNRKNVYWTYINLMVVFLLCGFWHGANWTFLAWGLYHGSLLIFERITNERDIEHSSLIKLFIHRTTTLLLVIVGWVLFRAETLPQAVAYLSAMFIPQHQPVPLEILLTLNGRNLSFLVLASLVFFLPRHFSGAKFLLIKHRPSLAITKLAMLALLTFYALASLASGSYNPFIYFQF